jgi:hypothetical protein
VSKRGRSGSGIDGASGHRDTVSYYWTRSGRLIDGTTLTTTRHLVLTTPQDTRRLDHACRPVLLPVSQYVSDTKNTSLKTSPKAKCTAAATAHTWTCAWQAATPH